MDADAGVCYLYAAREADVDALIAKFADDEYNEIDGISDLGLPLQGYPGIAPDDWTSGVRTPRRR